MNIGKHVNFICRNKIQNMKNEQWTNLYSKIYTTTWVLIDDITRKPIDNEIYRLAWNILRETRTHLCTYNN